MNASFSENEITPIEMAAILYRLVFPKRDFFALPEHVQQAYIEDGRRLKKLLDEQCYKVTR